MVSPNWIGLALLPLFNFAAAAAAESAVDLVPLVFLNTSLGANANGIITSDKWLELNSSLDDLTYQPSPGAPDQPFNISYVFAGSRTCLIGDDFAEDVNITVVDLETNEETDRRYASSPDRSRLCIELSTTNKPYQIKVYDGIGKLIRIQLEACIMAPPDAKQADIIRTPLEMVVDSKVTSDPAVTFSDRTGVETGLQGIIVKDTSATISIPKNASVVVPRGPSHPSMEGFVPSFEPQLPDGWRNAQDPMKWLTVKQASSVTQHQNASYVNWRSTLAFWVLDPTVEYTVTLTAPPGQRGFALTHLDVFNVEGYNGTGISPLQATNATETQSTATNTQTALLSSRPTGATESEGRRRVNAGAIAGGVLGSIVGLIFILLLLWWFCIRRWRQRAHDSESILPSNCTFVSRSTSDVSTAQTDLNREQHVTPFRELRGFSLPLSHRTSASDLSSPSWDLGTPGGGQSTPTWEGRETPPKRHYDLVPLDIHSPAENVSSPLSASVVRHDTDVGTLQRIEELLPPMYNPSWTPTRENINEFIVRESDPGHTSFVTRQTKGSTN